MMGGYAYSMMSGYTYNSSRSGTQAHLYILKISLQHVKIMYALLN